MYENKVSKDIVGMKIPYQLNKYERRIVQGLMVRFSNGVLMDLLLH